MIKPVFMLFHWPVKCIGNSICTAVVFIAEYTKANAWVPAHREAQAARTPASQLPVNRSLILVSISNKKLPYESILRLKSLLIQYINMVD